MRANLRIALFTDSYLEVNGVANTSRQLAAQAQRQDQPFLVIHAGPRTGEVTEGSLQRLILHRSRVGFRLDSDLRFDLLIWRHARRVIATIERFRPDLIHLTGPSDIGLLGALVASRLRIPIITSWHTNVHEYARRRLDSLGTRIGLSLPDRVGALVEEACLIPLGWFHGLGRILLAPNVELATLLGAKCNRPTRLMRRGVDTTLFSPAKRDRHEEIFNIGYVGRLTAEKNVRSLAEIERELLGQGCQAIRFTIVGTGSELGWLRQAMKKAVFTGVLKGEALARTYANLDLFVFPSTTDTFGNVVLEALASGVPAIVSSGGGPKYIVSDGETGFIANQASDISRLICQLYHHPEQRAEMALAARHHAEKMGWESIFAELMNAYDDSLLKGAVGH
ncbi:MAG: glycosyltransferase, partial [Acidobacteriota bacterium]